MHIDLSDYTPDPVLVCPPGHHTSAYNRADDSYSEHCTTCGISLCDADEELEWHLDQIVNTNPPSATDEEN